MNTISLHNEIIVWLKEYPYWFQFAGKKFLNGDPLNELLIEDTYKLFLEDEDLSEKVISREDIRLSYEPKISSKAVHLKLYEIKEIANVNALSAGQSISINNNLTIIYGNNGTGKSGYIRLLNNAFKGRGDKEIINNVFTKNTNEPASCKFLFKDSTDVIELQYPKDKDNEIFSQISIFDSHCVKVHLEQENSLQFTPSGFDFFNKCINLFEELRKKHQASINENKKSNEYIPLFRNNNSIQEKVISLNAKTDIKELKALANYSENDIKAHEELTREKVKLQELNIPQKIMEQQQLQIQLKSFLADIQDHLNILSTESILEINNTIDLIKHYETLIATEGVESFKTENIENIGSKPWRDFILAAKQYASTINTKQEGEGNYPAYDNKCLFCLQSLTQKESDLINAYWTLLASEAEVKLQETLSKVSEQEEKVKKLKLLTFDNSTSLFKYIDKVNPNLASSWQQKIQSLEQNKKNLLSNLNRKEKKEPVIEANYSITDFETMQKEIETAISDLSIKNPSNEIAAIDVQLQNLDDKNLFSKLLDKIIEFVNHQKWIALAEKKLNSLRTNSITAKQGELFASHITDRYTTLFNEECKKLKAPTVVNISQRNTKGQTLRKLQVAAQSANRILSEGEQRAVCLADFLTEIQLNQRNGGIIFDDPVTSMDHERRELIANRLVKEAKQRQVIIFTHDIAFLLQLQYFAENVQSIPLSITTIRKQAGQVGIVHPSLPWVAQKVKDRIAYLRNALVKLKSIEKNGSEDEYVHATKTWYGLLREAWERTVEERLFKGVVERFAPGVQTNKLKKLSITPQMLKDIDTGMTESSKWVHDAAAGLNPKVPDTIKAEEDLLFLDEFSKTCVAA